jgi:multisubunit Na+/H+ antiporter MnhF subunit
VDLLPDGHELLLHVFDLHDEAWWIDTIKTRYEQPHHRGVRDTRHRRRPRMTTVTLLAVASLFALACVVLAMLLCTLRLLIGPSAQDRVLALDTLWMCIMLLALMLGIRYRQSDLFRGRADHRSARFRLHHRAGEVPDARRGDRMNSAEDLPWWAAIPVACCWCSVG